MPRAVAAGGAAQLLARLARAARRGARREPAHRSTPTAATSRATSAFSPATGAARPAPRRWRAVSTSDLRAWMAHERGRGLSARSLARALSAVQGLPRLARRGRGLPAPAVTATRGPRVKPRLPRPVAPDAAKALIATRRGAEPRALDRGARRRRGDAALRLRPAHLRGARPAGRPTRRSRDDAAHPRQGRHASAWCRCCRWRRAAVASLPRAPALHARPGGAAVPRRARRRRSTRGTCRRRWRAARMQLGLPGDGDAACAAPLLRDASPRGAAATCAPSRSCSATRRLATTQVYTGVDQVRLMEAYAAAHPKARG